MSVNTGRMEHQIVPWPRFAVRCACGFAHDSSAETAEGAIEDVRAKHDPNCTEYVATPYTYCVCDRALLPPRPPHTTRKCVCGEVVDFGSPVVNP